MDGQTGSDNKISQRIEASWPTVRYGQVNMTIRKVAECSLVDNLIALKETYLANVSTGCSHRTG